MSSDDDKDSKTEDPSEKKLNDAFEKGNVPFSREVVNVSSILAILLVLYFQVPSFVNSQIVVLRSMFANIDEWPLDTSGDVVNLGQIIGSKLMLGLAPIVLPIAIFGALASLSQNQPRIVLTRIQPKMENISLAKGVKKLFGRNGVQEFIKSLFKFTAAAIIGTIVCISQMDWVISHIMFDSIYIPSTIHILVVQVCLGLFLTMVILAAIDFVWSKQEWFENQKMTHQEVKDEHKQSEGDPMVKMRNKSLAQDRARRRMITQVDDATLVIANPTHFAVALRYRPEVDKAPLVLAKGQDLIALKIRARAEENGVPVIEDKPLARSMYDLVQVDQEIPIEFYVPIAKIVRILSDSE
jgi:flagellar biosynthetic protein FlhB